MSEFHAVATATATPSEQLAARELGGFDLGLHRRNAALVASVAGSKLPKATKTGTTICGVAFANGIVLGADTRATEGTIISDKNCEKIHYIAPNIYCCGAGTAADTESITKLISSQLELLRLQTGTQSRVVAAMTQLKRRLFQYQGQVSAALVLGGVDATGAHLYTVYPHGSTDKLPFVSMGSGSLAAMAVLESGFRDDLPEADAVALVAAAVRAGIFNDLGSGSNVDITVIRSPAPGAARGAPADVSILRGFQTLNDVAPLRAKIARPPSRVIPRGATVVLAESFAPAAGAPPRAAGAAAAAAGGGGGGVSESKMDLE